MIKLPHNPKNKDELQKEVIYNENYAILKGSLRTCLTYLGIFPLNDICPQFTRTYSILPENSFHLRDFLL